MRVPAYVDRGLVGVSGADEAPCPLCSGDREPAPARVLPEMTPLGCRGLTLLAAVGVVLAIPEPDAVRMMSVGDSFVREVLTPGPVPSRSLEVAAPPPRVLA